MANENLVLKASGEKELFDNEKLIESLKRAGAKQNIIDKIVIEIKNILYDGIPTKEIYKKAFRLLKSYRRSNAARYKLRNALMELGPTGYPFEHFVGQLYKIREYDIQVGIVVPGKCVTHEVDVIATANNMQYLVECKFYNSQNKYASVTVPLYIKSRVEDIVAIRKNLPEYKDYDFKGVVYTNTRFTSDALQFGTCAGLEMVSWDEPKNHSLKNIIEKYRIFPITTITSLTKKHKHDLLNKGIVLCRQLLNNNEAINELGLSKKMKRELILEIEELCGQV